MNDTIVNLRREEKTMTMDIECEGDGCEEIAEMATPPPEEAEEIRITKEALRRYEINFVEFLLLRHLDVFHPQAKPDVWWDVWYQNKEWEREVVTLEGGGEEEGEGENRG